MREFLIVIGLLVLAVALRSARVNLLRKLGAFTLLAASFCLFYFITGHLLGGLIGAALWFFLPWIELLTRIRRMRLPLNNRLRHREVPNPSFFPNATEAAAAMEEAGFEHVSDCGWEWAGMKQFFRLFWHPEERAIAAVCLCEQSNVAFAFITITSHDGDGKIWRTTNFPFAPTLKITTTTRRHQLLVHEMDINAGRYLDGESFESLAAESFERTLATASGKKTQGEHAGHAQVSLLRNWAQTDGSRLSAIRARPVPDGVPLQVGPGVPLGPTVALNIFAADHGPATERVALVLPTSLCAAQISRLAADSDFAV